MQDRGISGKLGRVILARYYPFIADADGVWTKQNLIPLLSPGNDDFISAWDGLSYCGTMTPQAAELLREPFLNAVEIVTLEPDSERLGRFITKYVSMLTWFVTAPTDKWVTALFTTNNSDTKRRFAHEISRYLPSLNETQQREWWSVWLKEYWENRLQGVPSPLDDAEIAEMLEWVIHLRGVFPEAVNVATQMRRIPLSQSLMLHRIGESS